MTTKPIDRDTINTALACLEADAQERETSAAFSGSFSDGGAGHLRTLAAAYRSGLDGTVPDFLRSYITKAKRINNPEYTEYQRLKAKFKDQ